MANTIAQVTQYLKDTVALNEVFKQRSLTMDIEQPKVQFVGANVVKLPKITFGAGLGTYSRATGHVANDMTLAWDTYTLSQDKGNKLLLDAMDDEEGLSASIVPYVNQYIRTVVVPAVDTYRFGKLAAGAGTIKYSITLDAATVIDKMQEAIETFLTNEVPAEGNIFYITPAMDTLLTTNSDISRRIEVGAWNGNVDLKVRQYGGNKIVVVPASRLGTGVNFMLVNPDAVMGVVKHNPAAFFPQGTVPGYDGSEVDYRLYHDMFVIENKQKGIFASLSTADPEA